MFHNDCKDSRLLFNQNSNNNNNDQSINRNMLLKSTRGEPTTFFHGLS